MVIVVAVRMLVLVGYVGNAAYSVWWLLNRGDDLWVYGLIPLAWSIVGTGFYASLLLYGTRDLRSLSLALRVIDVAAMSASWVLSCRMTNKLKQRSREFRAFFYQSAAGCAFTSLDCRWLEVNDRLCEMLGYTKDELLRMTWMDVTHPEDLTGDLELFEMVKRGELDRYTYKKRYIHKSGEVIHVLMNTTGVHRDNGPYIFATTICDITEQEHITQRLETDRNALVQAIRIATE